MANTPREKTVGAVHWMLHCRSWFGFSEPAKFAEHPDGGFFASNATGQQIHSIAQNGFTEPS